MSVKVASELAGKDWAVQSRDEDGTQWPSDQKMIVLLQEIRDLLAGETLEHVQGATVPKPRRRKVK